MRSARVVLVPSIVLTLVMAACGGTSPAATSAPGTSGAAATQTPKPSPVSVKSSYGNVTPSNLAPFLAKELGIFEKYNLNVTLDLIDGGVASSAALVSGQTQVGNFGGTEAMSAVAGGSDMQVIALFVPVTPWQLLAKSDFKSPADLKGKTIGVASIGGSAYIDAEIEALGIAKKDKAKTLPILAKLLKLDMNKPDDATAVSQTYDFYVQNIFPLYPHPTVASFNASRDALVAQNPNVKGMDVTKVFDDKYVADAEKRGVGK